MSPQHIKRATQLGQALSGKMTALLIDLYAPYYFGGRVPSLTETWKEAAQRATKVDTALDAAGTAFKHTDAWVQDVEKPITFNPKNLPFRDKKNQARALALHEATHFTGISRNDLITANALQEYLTKLPEIVTAQKGTLPIFVMPEIERGFTEKALRMIYWGGHTGHAEHGHPTHKAALPFKFDFAPLGRELAKAAINIELAKNKPGLGLFVIRDISMGKSFIDVVNSVTRKAYERERLALLRHHPVLRKALYSSPIYRNRVQKRRPSPKNVKRTPARRRR